MVLPRWRWTRAGWSTDRPPSEAEIKSSFHPDVQKLAAVWKGEGWYPQVFASVEKVAPDGYEVTFWPADPGFRCTGWIPDWLLNKEDFQKLLNEIENPTPPTEALKALFRKDKI